MQNQLQTGYKKKRHCKAVFSFLVAFIFVINCLSPMKVYASNALGTLNLYGQRADQHCAEASLACVEAYRIGLLEADNPAIYWACWAVTSGGKNMPGDGFKAITKSSSAICAEIDKGNPVLLYFSNYGQPGNNHWVVAYGYEGNGSDFGKIKIMCPSHNGSTPTAYYTTLAAAGCTLSNLQSAKVVNGGFVQSVNGNTVIADGVFSSISVSNISSNDATISFSMRSEGTAGHDCNDVGFIISASPDMSNATVHRETDLNASSRINGVFRDVITASYSMSRWHSSYRSNTNYYFQVFIEKNGVMIKSRVRSLTATPQIVEGDVTPPTISSVRINTCNQNYYRVLLKASDDIGGKDGIDKVVFKSYTVSGGDDDLVESTATTYTENNNFTTTVYWKDHNNENGDYRTDCYVYDKSGNISTQTITIIRYIFSGAGLSSDNQLNMVADTNTTLSFAPSLAGGVSVSWSSSDTNIATVDSNGVVKAKTAGTATITATLVMPEDNRIEYTIATTLTVTDPYVLVNSISFPTSEISLLVNDTLKPAVEIAPKNATNKELIWASTNTNVANVDENGVITAVSPGTAVISVFSKDGFGATASCTVTVRERPNFDDFSAPEGCVFQYRLYNPNSGEHFYTGSQEETLNLVKAGWNFEGAGFITPKTGNPIYRLYSEEHGDHFYTTDESERDALLADNWTLDGGTGIAFPSATKETGRPMYRLYNPNAYPNGEAGAHHFTMSWEEVENLQAEGWQYEFIAWYSV